MKFRSLIVATAVLAALSGVLYWSNHRKPQDDTAKAASDAPPKILSLNESDITALTIRKKGQPAVELAKISGAWQITVSDREGRNIQTLAAGPGNNVQPDWGQ